ncbi:translocation/assembly module TamB domain-containing protein [Desulfacinum hydrothermale]|nr:translocation/assembly module TamB domain-containing protein [Desulfacinum hydrothermale]
MRGVLAVLGVVLIAAIALMLAIHVPWVQGKVIAYGSDWVRNTLGIELNVGKVAWNPFRGIRLEQVRAAVAQKRFLEAEAVALDYGLTLAPPYFHARRLTLVRPLLDLEKGPDGRWILPVSSSRKGETSDGGPIRWDKLPLPSLRVIQARVRAHEDGQKILDIQEMTGTLRLEGFVRDDGSSGLNIRLDKWQGTVQVPAYGPIALSGALSWAADRLTVETLEVRADEGVSGRLEGRWDSFPSGALDLHLAYSAACPNPILPRLSGICAGGEGLEGRVRVLGSLRDFQATYELQLLGGQVRGVAHVRQRDQALSATASVAFEKLKASFRRDITARLSGNADLKVERSAAGQIQGNLGLSIRQGTAAGLSLAGTKINGTWTPGALDIGEALVNLGPGRVQLSGRVLLPQKAKAPEDGPSAPIALDLQVKGKDLDLAVLGRALGRKSLSGTLNLDGTLSGPWPAPVWDGSLSASDVEGFGVRAGALSIQGKGRLWGRAGPRHVAVRLSSFVLKDTRGQSLSVELMQSGSDEIRFQATGEGIQGSGAFSVQGRVENVWDLPKVFQVERGTARLGKDGVRFEGRGRLAASEVELDAWRLEHGTESLSLSGRLTRKGPRRLRLTFQGVDLGTWSKRLAKRTMGTGIVDGSLVMDGSWESPVLSYEVSGRGIRPMGGSGSVPAALQVRGTYRQGFWDFKGQVRSEPGNAVVDLQGRWPLALDWPSRSFRSPDDSQGVIQLDSHGFPLEILTGYLPFMKSLKGSLDARIRLAGSFKDLQLQGEGRLEDGAFQLKSWKEPFQDIQARWRLDNERLWIENARLRLLEGDVTAHGVLRHKMGKVLGYELQASGTNVHFPELFGIEGRGRATAVFSQEGGAFRPDVKGKIHLSQADMRLGELERDLARNIHVVGDREEGPVVYLGESRKVKRRPGLFQRTTLDLEVHLPKEGSWVRGYGLEALVQGVAKIQKARRGPVRLYGALQATQGEYFFQGVRLKLVRGELTFRGLERPDPLLDVTCEKNVRDVSITASLSGPLSRPVLNFSSSPSMDQVDIVSYLLYGRAAGELNAQQAGALQRRGVQFVGSGTTAVVRDMLGETPLKPDVFELKGTTGGNVVEIGKYVTPELFVTYQKGVTGDEKDQLRAEYRLNRHISVESQWGREDQSGVDVFFRYDFGD